jgi:serine/threonine-protein kinase HipA
VRGGSFDASLDIALEACVFFELTPQEAERSAKTMAETLERNWKQALRTEGASPGDVGVYADAFEHAEADKALSLPAS